MRANDDDILQYQNLKHRLKALEDERAQGAWLRSRLQFIEKYERNTSYLITNARKHMKRKLYMS